MYRQSLNFICIPYYARLSQCLLQKVRCGATSIKTPSTFITVSRIKNIIWYIKYRSFCIDTNIVSIIRTIIKILITNLWFYVLFLYFFYVKKNGQKYLGLQHSIWASDSNFLLTQIFFFRASLWLALISGTAGMICISRIYICFIFYCR